MQVKGCSSPLKRHSGQIRVMGGSLHIVTLATPTASKNTIMLKASNMDTTHRQAPTNPKVAPSNRACFTILWKDLYEQSKFASIWPQRCRNQWWPVCGT
eukprot:6285075-Amphidinium_carterae.1